MFTGLSEDYVQSEKRYKARGRGTYLLSTYYPPPVNCIVGNVGPPMESHYGEFKNKCSTLIQQKQIYRLLHSTHSSSSSKHSSYITHNATEPLSDITGGNWLDFKQLLHLPAPLYTWPALKSSLYFLFCSNIWPAYSERNLKCWRPCQATMTLSWMSSNSGWFSLFLSFFLLMFLNVRFVLSALHCMCEDLQQQQRKNRSTAREVSTLTNSERTTKMKNKYTLF